MPFIKPFNILFFSSFGHLHWGGQKSLFHLVTRLSRSKYTPHVIVPTDAELAEDLRQRGIDVIVHPLPPINWRQLRLFLSSVHFLLRLIKEKYIHILHTDGPRNTLYGALVAKWLGVPVVWHVRSSDKDPLDPLLTTFCNRIILVADSLRQRFTCRKGRGKFVTVYNGVDLQEFDNAPTNPIRKILGLGDDVLLIGSFARIDPMKGQSGLIEACGMLGDDIDFRLFIYGDISDPVYHRLCLATADRWGISEKVIFPGFQKDVAPLLKAMDIVVLNSYGEAFPRAVIEAMAASRPVIASDVGGTKEAIEEGITGFIIPPGDGATLRDRINKLATDPSLRQRLGAAGRKRVEALFSLEVNMQKTEFIYEELLESKHE